MNCIRSQKEYFNDSQTHFDSIYARDTVPFSEITQYYTSMFLYNSSSVNIIDTDTIATVMASFTAILIVNIQDLSKIINIKVQINAANCTTYNYPVRTSGIVVYFSDGIAKESKLVLGNFYYYSNSYESCRNHFHCIITLIFLENDRECQKFPLNLKIFIRDSVFSSLKNSSIICYYGEAHIDKRYDFVRNMSVIIKNSTISNNIGYHNLSMFYIALKSLSHVPFTSSWFIKSHELKRMYNLFVFNNCVFRNNSDINAVIYVKPPTTDVILGHIKIINSTFKKNKNAHFIMVKKEYQTLWHMTTQFMMSNVNISNNEHSDGHSLILVTSGIITLRNVFFSQNIYYSNIISLRSSMLFFHHYTEMINNHVRQVIKAQSKSFVFIDVAAIVNISHNAVYKRLL